MLIRYFMPDGYEHSVYGASPFLTLVLDNGETITVDATCDEHTSTVIGISEPVTIAAL
jgi:hypothetical protein